jgi:hypothetical protein
MGQRVDWSLKLQSLSPCLYDQATTGQVKSETTREETMAGYLKLALMTQTIKAPMLWKCLRNQMLQQQNDRGMRYQQIVDHDSTVRFVTFCLLLLIVYRVAKLFDFCQIIAIRFFVGRHCLPESVANVWHFETPNECGNM